MSIDYKAISDNKEVIELIKKKMEIEEKIKALDEFALVLLEFQLLQINN